jgi:hypothetical protein
MTAAWTTVTRPNVTLFGGSRDVVEIVIRPPAIHTTTAGPTPAAVRVIPQQQPEEAIVAETLLDVQSFDDRRITMLQPLRRGRRRATYEFMVENHGNNLASCRLHLVYHLTTTEHYSTGDNVASLIGLALDVVLPLGLLYLVSDGAQRAPARPAKAEGL